MGVQALRWAALWFAVIVVFAGPFIARRYAPYPYEDRLYPLWANVLFAGFPYASRSYAIKIYKIDDRVYDPGIDLFSLFPTVEGQTSSPSVIIDAMGTSFANKNAHALGSERATFEAMLFEKFNVVEYSLNRIEWFPVERYLTGRLQKDSPLVHFRYSKAP